METFENKIVLVTGGTGLVGSHLVENLLEKRAQVVVPYRSINPFSYFASRKLGDRVIMVAGDIKDTGRIFDIVTKYEIDYIFHLAAQPIVTTAYDNPLETILVNVVGTTNILEAARCYPRVRGVVVASSDKAYGKPQGTSVETDPLRGDHPYEVSKSAADMICHTYVKTYGLPVVVTRFGNIYGPGDLHFNRIVPGLIRSIVDKIPLVVRSDGSPLRDYIYVKDVARAYIFLIEHLKKTKGESFNIASHDSYSVKGLISEAQKILHTRIAYVIKNSAINEIPEQHLQWKKIRSLGWKPTYTLKTALPETFEWYKTYGINKKFTQAK